MKKLHENRKTEDRLAVLEQDVAALHALAVELAAGRLKPPAPQLRLVSGDEDDPE